MESYGSQLTVIGADRTPRQFAYVPGAPNSCVIGADGEMYVCQNGGTVGPWRAKEMTRPSIQRFREGGKAETSSRKSMDQHSTAPTISSSPPTAAWSSPIPAPTIRAIPIRATSSRLTPDGNASVLIAFPKPVFPNGVAVEADGSILWDESYTGHVGTAPS